MTQFMDLVCVRMAIAQGHETFPCDNTLHPTDLSVPLYGHRCCHNYITPKGEAAYVTL